MMSGMRHFIAEEQLRVNARALGLADEQINAVVDDWRTTPYDRDHLWRMLIDEACRAR